MIKRIQERKKSLGVLENTQFGFTLSPVAYITGDSEKMVRDLFHPAWFRFGIKQFYQEEKSYRNSPET